STTSKPTPPEVVRPLAAPQPRKSASNATKATSTTKANTTNVSLPPGIEEDNEVTEIDPIARGRADETHGAKATAVIGLYADDADDDTDDARALAASRQIVVSAKSVRTPHVPFSPLDASLPPRREQPPSIPIPTALIAPAIELEFPKSTPVLAV